MINEFSVSPRPSNNKGRNLFFVFLTLAAATAVAYISVPMYKGVVGMVCLLLIVAAIYVYNRYMGMKYYYDVMIDSSDTPLFIVRSAMGKRESTLCRVELSSIVSVKRFTADELKNHKAPDGYVRYFYNPTLSPEFVCIVTTVTRFERAEITIEANDDFINILSAYAREAREAFPADEE